MTQNLGSRQPVPYRRLLGLSMLGLATAGLLGCSTAPPAAAQDSQLSYDRTFEAALGAIAEQKMTFGVQDRRQGRIEGTRNGDTVTATLSMQLDGTIRVVFAQDGKNDPDLLKRVVEGYNARLRGAARLLPPGTL